MVVLFRVYGSPRSREGRFLPVDASSWFHWCYGTGCVWRRCPASPGVTGSQRILTQVSLGISSSALMGARECADCDRHQRAQTLLERAMVSHGLPPRAWTANHVKASLPWMLTLCYVGMEHQDSETKQLFQQRYTAGCA
ncbi:hypothetical protein AAFF_G00381270 [Aldrovandia affinis]|uniref:Uncharacterized protein n=1 Tax=Aldrovandia affinis TaxID=143900 RepID=A0AAD7T857_9TELE|nr:hypothetical protein AAFF_G00381270 [Aldrovandia affinis]